MSLSDHKLLLFGHTLPGNENFLLDRIRDCAEQRNKGFGAAHISSSLQQLPVDQISQIVAGHNHIAFLLKDYRVARLHYEIVKNTIEPTIPIDNKRDPGAFPPAPSNTGAANPSASGAPPSDATVNAANRTAKIRRIMMARPGVRSGGFCRTGAIIDRNRNRQVIPASTVPEELIVQCQVVLQGKSREVIVRELQRTNLNVNEAVNNFLSRDDDEIDDMDEASEAYLHEELLSLLDAGLRSDTGVAAAALLDNESIYSAGDGYEYLITRDLARRRAEDGKSKEPAKETDSGQIIQEQFVFGDQLIYWGTDNGTNTETQINYPPGVTKFLKISSMHSDLLALADDGKIYNWSWEKQAKPSNKPHQSMEKLLGNDSSAEERIVDMEACGLRTAVLTNSGKVGSFMDVSCGRKLSESFVETPIEVLEPVSQLFTCTLYSAVLTKSGNIFWRGIFPFNERRKIWEKLRSKKKQVTFDTGTEIVVGSEVRTKSTPIYSVGSVAVNFTEGLPLIGVLYEDAWTLNELCRFRVHTPESYDVIQLEKPAIQKEKRVSFNLAGNRKRPPSAPEAGRTGADAAGTDGNVTQSGQSSNSSSKESAWNLKDVIFIHEEAVNDTSIVKIVDGAYCGVVSKSTMEKLEAEGTMDIGKMGIRLMRKDDLVSVTANTRSARSPENFQTQFKQIRLPPSIKRIMSLAIDLTGFRVLCEKRDRAHLLRVSCLGKLLSDHPLPLNLPALCQTSNGDETITLPAVNNYGDEGLLLMRDGNGNFQPLLRNAVGGFKELSYTGLGRIYRFGLGIQYLKSPSEINSTTVCTEQYSLDKKQIKSTMVNKNPKRILLIAALLGPSPDVVQPRNVSLMQAILFCDLQMVKEVIKRATTADETNSEELKALICERIDGNRNIFHIASMNASAKSNKEQADVESDETSQIAVGSAGESQSKYETNEAEASKSRYDKKWQESMLAPTTRAKAKEAAAAIKEQEVVKKEAASNSRGSSKEKNIIILEKDMIEESDENETIGSKIPTTPKQRQANSIEIINELCSWPLMEKYYPELMQQRDINGFTPFELAISSRAYSAALTMWKTAQDMKDWSQDIVDILLSNGVGRKSTDDSALFILCANDTCSYTWTGEEHTPQDIYECKTCGLVGTLCCCSECAYICHRKHDCKLKKTSPTAYCDCWEKSECKTLVEGNSAKRLQLLQLMLRNNRLLGAMNSNGEHFIMFLARTVGRQIVEQENYLKRGKRPGPGSTTNGIRIPEHDLEPPKFARRALDLALSNWDAVRTLLEIGVKKRAGEEEPILESAFHLGEHNGSTKIDKFVFTLLAWCEESSLDTLLNLLVRQANKQKSPDADVHNLIQRFVRSVIRLFILVVLLSPNSVGTLLATITENINKALPSTDAPVSPLMALSSSVAPSTQTPGTTPAGSLRESLQNYRAVAISGMLSLVRASLPAALGLSTSGADKKDHKKNKIAAFIAKCRRVFQTLLSYSVLELIGAADALIAPVRNGIVKPTSRIYANDDVLDLIQQHLSNEHDLSTLIKEATENVGANANLASNEGATDRIKKYMDSQRGPENRPSGGNEAANERTSDDENSNDEDEDDEETDGGPTTASLPRTRESSNTSFVPRERAGSHQSRRRQDTNNTADNEENMEEDHEEEEDEDDSDHEMDEYHDDEEEPYFDIHDDDDDDDDDDGEDSDNSDDNAPDAEADSNDTATVAIGSAPETTTTANTTGATRSAPAATSSAATPAADAPSIVTMDAALSRSEIEADIAALQQSVSTAVSSESGFGNGNGGSRHQSSQRTPWSGSTSATSTAGTPISNNNNTGWRSADINTRGWPTLDSTSTTASGENATSQNNSNVTRESSRPRDPRTAHQSSTPGTEATGTSAANTLATIAVAAPNAAIEPDDGNGYSPNNTSTQLSTSFSVIVKLVDELLVHLMVYPKWKQQVSRSRGITSMLDIDPKLFATYKKIIEEYYEPTWSWFHLVMDRTEAQLKYGTAVTTSTSVLPFLNTLTNAEHDAAQREDQASSARTRGIIEGVQPRYKKRTDKNKQRAVAGIDGNGENDAETGVGRYEYFKYFLSLLRSAAAENADDLPVLEYSALKNIAFIAEAYLFHVMFMDQLKQVEVEISPNAGGPPIEFIDEKESLMEIDTSNIDNQKKNKLRRFYQRSNSISYPLLSTADDHHGFTYTAAEALPLSTNVHLLNAEIERESLFALPTRYRSRQAHRKIASEHGIKYPTHQSLAFAPLKYAELIERQQRQPYDNLTPPPQKQPPTSRQISVQHFEGSGGQSDDIGVILNSKFGLTFNALQRLLGRWSKTITFFTRTFHEDLINSFGGESTHSTLLNKTGVCSFNIRHSQFRKQMDRLKSSQAKDIVFTQMPREKYTLIQQTFRQLNQHYVRRLSAISSTATPTQQMQQPPFTNPFSSAVDGPQRPPPLASHNVKVTFRDEPGEGTGVARHFYAAIAEALTTIKHLSTPDNLLNEDGTSKGLEPKGAPGKSASTGTATALSTPATTKSKTTAAPATTFAATTTTSSTLGAKRGGSVEGGGNNNDTQPLFYRIGKTGFYSPIAGTGSTQRLNAFRNVGRLIGICLLHMEIFPLQLSRHVLKFILGRSITWFDLAFFDPNLFDSLRSIVYNEETDQYHPGEFYEQLEMTFSLDLPAEEGGGNLELKPGGSEIAVTRQNVLEYIYLIVEQRLLGPHTTCLEAIRRGVFDVIPVDSLANLTAEDFRLILCGTQDVNMQLLQNFTKFLDESSASAEVLAKYKKTFWAVVNKLSTSEKQDLCFFWTGSPNLPSTEEGFQPLPTIMIRPADDVHLPTANTCISRLYLPLYSSKKILASKLQLAIKARNFGFV